MPQWLHLYYNRGVNLLYRTHKSNKESRLLPDAGDLLVISSFLDEIPLLLNVLKGDMIIVEPRPFIPVLILKKPESLLILKDLIKFALAKGDYMYPLLQTITKNAGTI